MNQGQGHVYLEEITAPLMELPSEKQKCFILVSESAVQVNKITHYRMGPKLLAVMDKILEYKESGLDR